VHWSCLPTELHRRLELRQVSKLPSGTADSPSLSFVRRDVVTTHHIHLVNPTTFAVGRQVQASS